jgi:hypothetical protein
VPASRHIDPSARWPALAMIYGVDADDGEPELCRVST